MKKRHEISEAIIYPLVIGLGFFIRLLPLRLSYWFANRLGAVVYCFYAKRRRIGYANVRAAFCQNLMPGEIKKITRRTFQHFVCVLFEVFRFPSIDKRYADRYVASSGTSHIDEALKKGRGAIILTAHFGNWELSGLVGAIKGYPQVVLARQQKYLRLNRLLNSYRARYGRRVIEKCMATREIITSLKENKITAILSDQDAGMQGALVSFFGRLASTAKGAAGLALKFDSPILPNFCARQRGPFYQMTIEKPLAIEETGDLETDIQAGLQKFTNILESYITRYPDQWLWLHKRWKTTPSRRILILTDGKAGHLNQALAVAKQIKKAVFERAEKDDRVRALKKSTENRVQRTDLNDLIYQEKIVEIKYRSSIHRAVLTLCSLFASKSCQGCMRCLKFCITAESYNGLMKTYADIVVSCGSQTATVNRFLCMENRGRGIVVNKPGVVPMSKFDLCIMPRHDNPKRLKNVLLTDGALNLMDEEYLAGQRKALMADMADKAKDTEISIGVLIGGDNKDFKLTKEAVNQALDAVIEFAKDKKAGIFATTSRRTSKNIDELVKARLSGLGCCKLLVIANERNIPGVVAGILGMCSAVVVSGESVSMVSEAASSAKKVVVFVPGLKNMQKIKKRHVVFMENLKSKGFIALCEPQEVDDAIKSVLQDTRPAKLLSDNVLVYEAVKRII